MSLLSLLLPTLLRAPAALAVNLNRLVRIALRCLDRSTMELYLSPRKPLAMTWRQGSEWVAMAHDGTSTWPEWNMRMRGFNRDYVLGWRPHMNEVAGSRWGTMESLNDAENRTLGAPGSRSRRSNHCL